MFAAYTSFYLGLAALPLAVCVSLYFVSPIFVTLLSALFLKEQVGARRWAAVFVGFLGVLIVLRPTSDVFDPAARLPVFAGFSYAVSAVIARRLGATESAPVMAVYANGVYLAAGLLMAAMLSQAGFSEDQHRSLAFLFRPWSMPTPFDLFLLAACGAIAAIGTVLLTQAYRLAQASTVAPYEYTALVWSLLYGWLAWGEFPDAVAWAGIALVVLAGLYTLSGAARASAPKHAAAPAVRPGSSDG
jgi:drug/metabolite transporter (DMT)-like permease